MKTIMRLPVSVVKIILAIVALPFGLFTILCVIGFYTRPQTWFTKKKEKTAET